MKNTLNKLLPVVAICASTLGFTASTDAGMMNQSSKSQNKMYKEITPPAGPNTDNGVGFSIYADYILMEARAGNTTFAYSGIARSGGGGIFESASKGSAYNPGFKYQSGFRVGASAMLGHDNWDVDAQYTWLNSTNKATTLPKSTDGKWYYQPTFTDTLGGEMIGGSAAWDMRFNAVQLNLGRNYMISENISMRPYAGIKGSWINQDLNINTTAFNGREEKWNNSLAQTWWGVGFQSGVDAGWWFDENWGIYANMGTALLWGKTSLSHIQKNVTNADNIQTAFNWDNTTYGVQPVLDLGMGFRWQMSFDDNTYAFLLQAGWEQQVWINNVKFTSGPAQSGDLSLQGFNLRARFFF